MNKELYLFFQAIAERTVYENKTAEGGISQQKLDRFFITLTDVFIDVFKKVWLRRVKIPYLKAKTQRLCLIPGFHALKAGLIQES
jgi:hypothetical protein